MNCTTLLLPLVFLAQILISNTALHAQSDSDSFVHNVDRENIFRLNRYTDNLPEPFFYLMKFSIVLDSNGNFEQIFFQNAELKFHLDMLRLLPQFKGASQADIDKLALYTKGRKLFLGTLLSTSSSEGYRGTIEIMSDDALEAPVIRKILDLVNERGAEAFEPLSYYPAPQQRKYVESARREFDALGIKIEEAKGGGDSACYAQGWGVGEIKRIAAEDLAEAVRNGTLLPSHILVTDQAPREVPAISGLIVSEESSPFSHAALLAKMRGVPFLYEKDAAGRAAN